MFKIFRHLVVLWLLLIMKKIWCCVSNICACLQTHSRSCKNGKSASKQNFAGIDELGECSRNSPQSSLTLSSSDIFDDSFTEESQFTCSDCEVFWFLREQVAAVDKTALQTVVHTGWILCRIDSHLYVAFGMTPDMLSHGTTVCGTNIYGPTLTEFLRKLGANRRLLKMDRTEINRHCDKQLITTVQLHTVDRGLETVLFEWLSQLCQLNGSLLCQAEATLQDKSVDKDAVVSLTTSKLTCSGFYANTMGEYTSQSNVEAKFNNEQREAYKQNQHSVNTHGDCTNDNDEESFSKISSRELLIPVCSKHFVINCRAACHSPTTTAMRIRKTSRTSVPYTHERPSKKTTTSQIFNLPSTSQDLQAKQRHLADDKDVKILPTPNGSEQSRLSSARMVIINESRLLRTRDQNGRSLNPFRQNADSAMSTPRPTTSVTTGRKSRYSNDQQPEHPLIQKCQPERLPEMLQCYGTEKKTRQPPSNTTVATCTDTLNTEPPQKINRKFIKRAPCEALSEPSKKVKGAANKESTRIATCGPPRAGAIKQDADQLTLKSGGITESSKNLSYSATQTATASTIPSTYGSRLEKRETDAKATTTNQCQSTGKPKCKPRTKSATHISAERLTDPKHARSKSISSVTEQHAKGAYSIGALRCLREGDGDKTDLDDSKVVESVKEPDRVSILTPKTQGTHIWEGAWQNDSINIVGSLIEPKLVKNCETYQVHTAARRNMADIIGYRRRSTEERHAPATAMETMVASLNNADIKKSDVKAIWTILNQQMDSSTGLDSLSKSEIFRSFDTLRSCKSTSSLIDLNVKTNNNSFRQLEPLIFLDQGEAIQALNLTNSSKQWCQQKQKMKKQVPRAGGNVTPKKSSSATTRERTSRNALTATVVDKLREARLLTHESDCYGNTATYLEYQVPTDKYLPCTSLQCKDDLYQIMPSSLIRPVVLEELQGRFSAVKSRVACVKQFRGCKTSLYEKADLERKFLQMLETHKLSAALANTGKGNEKATPKTPCGKFKQNTNDQKDDKSEETPQKQDLGGGLRTVARTEGKEVTTCRMTPTSETQKNKLPHTKGTQGQKSDESKTAKCKSPTMKQDGKMSIQDELTETIQLLDNALTECKNSSSPCQKIQWSTSAHPSGTEKSPSQPSISEGQTLEVSGVSATQSLSKQTPKKSKTCRKNAVQEMAREFAHAKEVTVQRVKVPEKQTMNEALFKRGIDSEIIDEKRITKMAVNTDIRLDDAISCGVKAKRGPRQQKEQRKQKVKTRKNTLNNLNEFGHQPVSQTLAQAWTMNNFEVGSSSEEDNTVYLYNEEKVSSSCVMTCVGKKRSPISDSVRQQEDVRHQYMAPAKIIGRKNRGSEEDDDLLFAGAKKNTTKKKDRRRRKIQAVY